MGEKAETDSAEKGAKTKPEQIIEDLGGCGRYQMRMGVLAHILKTPIGWAFVSFIIVSKTPDFWCDSDVNANMTYVEIINNTKYDAHKACKSIDGSKCTKFRFDDSLRTIISDFDLVCADAFAASTIMSIQMAGAAAGNFVTGHLADLIGRKIPLFSCIVIVIVAEFMSLAAEGWVLIAVTRFIIGISQGAFLGSSYSLLSEFTLAKHRAWVTGFPSWPLEASVLCLFAWLVHDWRYINLGCAIVGIPCLLAWWVIPESFRWYLAHGKREKAERIIEAVTSYNRQDKLDPKRLEEILNQDGNKKNQGYTVSHLFKTRKLARVTILMAITWFGHSFIVYGIGFGIRRLAGSVYLNLFLFSISSIPAKAIAIWTQNRFGRKSTSIFSFGCTTLACFGVGLVQNIVSDTDLRDSLTTGLALTAHVFVAVLWGPVQTMTMELYPTVIRNIGYGFLALVGNLGQIIAPQFDFLGDIQGVAGMVYFACGVAGLIGFLSMFGLPETKDVYLDDTIQPSKPEKNVE